MKTKPLISAALIAAFVMNPIAGWAEDIDLYSGNNASIGLPNVLIILDNSANWNTPFIAEKEALVTTVGGLNDTVNLGLMMFAETGGGNDSVDGGYVRFAVRQMTGTNKTALASMVNGLDQTSDKSNNAVYGLPMHEAYLYFAGLNSRSSIGKVKRDYVGNTANNPLAASLPGNSFISSSSNTLVSPISNGCQKNFIIFISNGPAGDNSSATSESTSLLSGVGGNTTAITLNPNGEQSNTADEWARFLSSTDLSATYDDVQSVRTYTVEVNPGTGGQGPDHTALMKSMAAYGKGKYFAVTGDASAIAQAILSILNEVQAVNSVFASSSLPVSVNAQGTYLNQIYMGMFRPDASGLPRWVGNLKQYQFGYNTTTQALSLVDSLGNSAISGAGTGFISPNAVSFWTTKNTAVQPDSGGGFWRNAPSSAGGGYDSPDGELVEKGGAAQVMRKAFLMNDYSTNPTSPRNMYTYCPSGTSCVAALTDTSNVFATTNGGISATMFGSSNVPVSSIVRTGTTALVTTSAPHGYSTGNSVTISNATQAEYNVTQNVTVNSSTTFTITGLPDLPTATTLGTYSASLYNAAGQAVSTVTRSTGATATGTYSAGCTPNLNCETVTVTTPAAHGYSASDVVTISGSSPGDYNGNKTIQTAPSTTTFTFRVPVYPTTPAANTYKAVIHPYTRTITNITKFGVATTSVAHGFHVGQSITISGASDSYFNTTWTITAVTSTTFTFSTTGNHTTTTGSVTPSTTPVTLTGITRNATTIAATATATGATASYFTNGDLVDITTVGTAPNESAYVISAATISCTGTCTSFTFPITTSPVLSASGTMTVALAGGFQNIAAGDITRSGTTATVKNVSPGAFSNGDELDISSTGTVYSAESAYTGTWTITCTTSPADTIGNPCTGTTFTFGPVTLSPATPATGNITAYSGSAPPDKTSLMNWVRGQDNLCDEASPDTGCPNQTTINIRPSLHGDVLHSRPTVINYGGTTGVIVFYGANDTAYRAVNGNQTNPAGSTLSAPGSELWSFIPTEFYGELARQRDNSPVLKLSTTPPGITPSPRKKDYFVDGSTSVYQKLNASGTTDLAYIYLAMRRGGSFLYALDVTTPTSPAFLWKINTSNADFTELGQTWSQPKVTFVKGYANPVLIFGGGYDPDAEDAEPPTADTMGRGIFIVDAITGTLVWKATYGAASSCSGTVTQAVCTVLGMNYSIPADITLVDRSGNDGYTDRLYATDVGGNIWRVDLEPSAGNTPDKWKITHLAALGCNTGACASGTTPRKFFYPADMVPSTTYDAILVGSGDREHPLYSNLSYSVTNRFYMVKDPNAGNEGSNTAYTEANLTNITPVSPATTTSYDGSLNGYYVTLGTGEKVVNAASTVAGYTYFGTNQPAVPSANSCDANLGIARGYRIQPISGGSLSSVVYDGGGLPPTAVAGSVIVNVNGVDTIMPFCIGCGGNPDCVGADCSTAIGGGKPPINVSTKRNRTYWYMEKN